MSIQTRHRFTTKEYYRMAEIGVLKPDARVELLNGQIIDLPRISPFHGGTVNRLNKLSNKPSAEQWLVAVHAPVSLNEYSEPQPDLMLLRPAPDYYSTRHSRPEDVFLLIEVADTSLAYVRNEKLAAYGNAGIREVWIVNLIEQTIEVHREPHYAGYGSATVLRAGGQARPLAFPDVAIDVAELLRRA